MRAGLGWETSSLSYLMTARALFFSGATSPFFAPIADKYGRRFGMLAGLAVFISGIAAVTIYPNLYTLAAGSYCRDRQVMFDPSMQADFGDRIPYAQRGTALAVTEVAWSAAFFAGVPFMALLPTGKYGC